MIDDILDYTKLEANKLVLEKLPFSLPALIENCVEIMGVNAEKKQIELACILDDSVPEMILGDRTR